MRKRVHSNRKSGVSASNGLELAKIETPLWLHGTTEHIAYRKNYWRVGQWTQKVQGGKDCAKSYILGIVDLQAFFARAPFGPGGLVAEPKGRLECAVEGRYYPPT